MHQRQTQSISSFSRRSLLAASAAASAMAVMNGVGTNFAHAAGSDRLRIGLVGCGGRGCGAAQDCIDAAASLDMNAEVTALADLFPDRIHGPKQLWKIPDAKVYSGFNAYQQLLNEGGVDLVILATPPGFRPRQLQAAVAAGKHVFVEKPVAVDPTGIRMVLEAAGLAEKKGLTLAAGTQRRHQASYIETIKRLHDGAIGQITGMSVYWNQGSLWNVPRRSTWSDAEWQIRNWLYFTWLSGDHIVEQHLHNLDIANWVMGSHPISAYGTGGRQVRTDAANGHVYDHFAVEYEYPNGARVMSMCRQQDGTETRVGEFVRGTKGTSDACRRIDGESSWHFSGDAPNPYVQEQVDLLKALRAGKPINEGRQVAESTLTAIMGRLAAYSGKTVTWEMAMASKLNLMPEKLELGPMPTPPVAMPGKDS